MTARHKTAGTRLFETKGTAARALQYILLAGASVLTVLPLLVIFFGSRITSYNVCYTKLLRSIV